MTEEELENATMPFDEFVVKYKREWTIHRREKGAQRKGQFLFNLLHDVRPDVANNLRGSMFDCFYNDVRIPAFLAWAKKVW